MKSDIDIYYDNKMENIVDIAKKVNLSEDDVDLYGKYKAKINKNNFDSKEGRLILVTSMNPTKYGEGKTTLSIGINDSLNYIGKKSIVVLREPSMGPVFGIKGGACGGGYSQVVPMEDINLHFTGDIHAITSANNLLSAIIDNHIYHGNELGIENVVFPRCLDVNDRALRDICIDGRSDNFVISVASEIMAILCLCKDLNDLKLRLSNILIGYNKDNKPLFVKDLKCEDALTIILKDVIKPNLVQTLYHNPAIVHGGPFANIAHGCNSYIATNMALHMADYVVTEAGFGADLGAEKFFDIKCRLNSLKPNLVVVNATIKAIKHHGGCSEDDLLKENIDCLDKGLINLKTHVENMYKFIDNVLIVINRFDTDTENEINYIKEYFNGLCDVCVSNAYKEGELGAVEVAKKVVELCDKNTKFNLLYEDNDSLINKIEKVCKEIYRACGINISEEVLNKLHSYEEEGFGNLPICIAKTQYSLSDNPKLLGKPSNFKINIKDVKLCSGAGFIIVYTGKIISMPGLAKKSAYLHMHINNDGVISGLF